MPRATPRTSRSTACPTAALSAGCPMPNETVTRETRHHQQHRGDHGGPEAGQEQGGRRRTPPAPATPSGRSRPADCWSAAARAARSPRSAPAAGRPGTAPSPSPTSTAGTATSWANQAAGIAAAARALRTTAGLRITDRGRNPCGRFRTWAVTPGTPTASSPMPTRATTSPLDGDWITRISPAAVTATSTAPVDVERSPRALTDERAPDERDHDQPEHRQRQHPAPPGDDLEQTAEERTEAGHERRHRGQPAERQAADVAVVAGADDRHPQHGDGGHSGALQQPGQQQEGERRREGRADRTDRHQRDAHQERDRGDRSGPRCGRRPPWRRRASARRR